MLDIGATLKTARGDIRTPVFMPVGTQGAVRTLSPHHLMETGSQIILANTYHLSQRPGEALVAKHGGLHRSTCRSSRTRVDFRSLASKRPPSPKRA